MRLLYAVQQRTFETASLDFWLRKVPFNIKRDELKSVLIDDSKGFAHVELNKDLAMAFNIPQTNDCILLQE
ncbi:hypothetical protein ACVXZZ_03815 [Staphylococcus aureus]